MKDVTIYQHFDNDIYIAYITNEVINKAKPKINENQKLNISLVRIYDMFDKIIPVTEEHLIVENLLLHYDNIINYYKVNPFSTINKFLKAANKMQKLTI